MKMDESLRSFVEKLKEIDEALKVCQDEAEKATLLSLKSDITDLINLTSQGDDGSQQQENDPLADEYAAFMQEMAKEGAVQLEDDENNRNNDIDQFREELKDLQGKQCSAPYAEHDGDVNYHNAMISSVTYPEDMNYSDIEVRVMFTNPIHKKMLPCPYFLQGDCKFSDDKCNFSHGELVLFSRLKDFVEPNFGSLIVGSTVLAKQPDKLWRRASITRLYGEKCTVKFQYSPKDIEINLHDVLPLDQSSINLADDSDGSEEDPIENEDVINMSLMTTPLSSALGGWESHTKGIGSKLMQKMGYIVGTGLGKRCDGRLEPVTAVILPTGKSLDYCMNLREKAGDENLFSAEKQLKKLQRQAEVRSKRQYEREKNKTDVFTVLNEKLLRKNPVTLSKMKTKHRQEIKQESSRGLNVASLKIDEEIKRCEREIWKIQESIDRQKEQKSKVYDNLKSKLHAKQVEMKSLKDKAVNISHEQQIRSDKKKLTIF